MRLRAVRGHGAGDAEAAVEFTLDGANPDIRIVHLDSRAMPWPAQSTSAKGELFLKSSPRVSIRPLSGQNMNE